MRKRINLDEDIPLWGLQGLTRNAMNHIEPSYKWDIIRGPYFIFKIRQEFSHLLTTSIFNRILRAIRHYYREAIMIDVVIINPKPKRYIYPKKAKPIEEEASNDFFHELDEAVNYLGY